MPLPMLAALGIGAGLKALKGGLEGAARAKSAKSAARNEQKATQWKVNQKQKGFNRRALNAAALLRSLKREGWFGDGFMRDFGTYDKANFTYDPVPLMETPGVWSSALGGALQGGVGGLSDWFLNSEAAGREAGGLAGGGIMSPGQPTGRAGMNTLGSWSLPQAGGVDILPTRRVGR